MDSTEKKKLDRARYAREWRKRNPERRKALDLKYRPIVMKRRAENIDAYRAYQREYQRKLRARRRGEQLADEAVTATASCDATVSAS